MGSAKTMSTPSSHSDSPWMQTRDTHAVDLIDIDFSEVTIEEVAHSLARLNRFNGHTRVAYSVAQHCCLVSEHLPPNLQFEGLMHDVHEIAIGDISTPVKRSLSRRGGGAALSSLDDDAMLAVSKRWPDPIRGVLLCTSDAVKEQDIRACVTERRDLMGGEAKPWGLSFGGKLVEPWPERIVAWEPAEAEEKFLALFRQLYDND